MKATGIVRRIDDLGRVVIPKEIRRTLRIREGDPLEIYTEKDGEVIFIRHWEIWGSLPGRSVNRSGRIPDISLRSATGMRSLRCTACRSGNSWTSAARRNWSS